MKKHISKFSLLVLSLVFIVVGCTESNNPTEPTNLSNEALAKKGFVHGIVLNIDGEDYYFAGAPDGPDGAFDIPGHYWVQTGPNRLVGKHYNTGPFDAPSWWVTDAPDGEFLYKVDVIIDTWTPEKVKSYAKRGYVHHHKFVNANGIAHPSKVPWLKHTARTSFYFDHGPLEYQHEVTPGVDFEFIPNGSNPYPPAT